MKKRLAVVCCNGGCRADERCLSGCVGCGVCVSVCRFEAIEINRIGVAEVNEARCIGCGACVRECPRSVIRLHERLQPIVVRCANESTGKREMCAVSCIGCGICEKVCPSGAISVRDHLARIDGELCLSCGQCLTHCPRGAICDLRGILQK